MTDFFNKKINLLKALAIMLVVSGHLEFSLIPGFPPYSFHIAFFFFISGMLFKENYSLGEFFKKRVKSLLVPYFLYSAFYLGLTVLITPFIGKFWAMPITLKNELLMPFLTGHQIDLSAPLWFVPQLFISLITYFAVSKTLNKLNCGDYVKLVLYTVLALSAIQLQPFSDNLWILLLLRTIFSLLFIYLGNLFMTRIEGKHNIFTMKYFLAVIVLQSILWLTNKDFTPLDGIGLSYILVWGQFDNWIVPILTSLTGIWMSLFIVNITYEHVKDWKFLEKIGRNTYHIMANHLLIFNLITYSVLYLKGIPFDVKNNADIYWFYYPLKSTYFYFIVGIFSTMYLGEFLRYLKNLTKKE